MSINMKYVESAETAFPTMIIKEESDHQDLLYVPEKPTVGSFSEAAIKLEPKYDIEYIELCNNSKSSAHLKQEEIDLKNDSESTTNCSNSSSCSASGLTSNSMLKGNICNYKTKKRSNMHLKTHVTEEAFTCKEYNYGLTDRALFKGHAGDNQFIRNMCEYKCLQNCSLDRNKICKKDQHYACTFCDFKTMEKLSLTKHIMMHTGEKPYACSQCDYKGVEKSHLDRHVTSKHLTERPFACSICDYKTADKSGLNRHMMVHTGEKPFTCSLCDYKTAQKPSLTKHERTHTGEKPFTCPVCELKTSDKSSLNRHMRLHVGAKPHSCDLCEYKATERNNLDRHVIRRHTNLKPVKCDLCEYRTAEVSYLRKHHMRVHTQERPFVCALCKYKSSEKRNLDRHLKIHEKRAMYRQKCEYNIPEDFDFHAS